MDFDVHGSAYCSGVGGDGLSYGGGSGCCHAKARVVYVKMPAVDRRCFRELRTGTLE